MANKSKEFQKKESEIDITTVYIGAQVHSLREERSLTQLQLGEMIKLSRASVVNIEAGRQATPIRVIMELCVALSVNPNDILPSNEWFLENRNKKARKVVTIEIYED